MDKKDFGKYSYFLFGQTGLKTIRQGTCFFVKKNGKTHLITASHNLNGWSPFKSEFDPVPETLYLRVYRKSDRVEEFLPIQTARFKKIIPQANGYEIPDIFSFEISIPDKFELNTLEGLIEGYVKPNVELSEIIIYGYPVIDELDDFEKYIRLPPSSANLTKSLNYDLPLKWLVDGGKEDYVNYQCEYTGSIVRYGHSGSPVYFKNQGQDGSEDVRFGGMLFSADPTRHTVNIVRPEYIQSLFEKLE